MLMTKYMLTIVQGASNALGHVCKSLCGDVDFLDKDYNNYY